LFDVSLNFIISCRDVNDASADQRSHPGPGPAGAQAAARGGLRGRVTLRDKKSRAAAAARRRGRKTTGPPAVQGLGRQEPGNPQLQTRYTYQQIKIKIFTLKI